MENTLINKTLFFAQYFGQEVLHIHNSPNNFKIQKLSFSDVSDNDFLELKPLSQISDSEAIELCALADYPQMIIVERHEDHLLIRPDINVVESEWDARELVRINFEYSSIYYDNMECYEDNSSYDLGLQVYDVLRQKGFALPYCGLSIADQISFGWIKLTSLKSE